MCRLNFALIVLAKATKAWSKIVKFHVFVRQNTGKEAAMELFLKDYSKPFTESYEIDMS